MKYKPKINKREYYLSFVRPRRRCLSRRAVEVDASLLTQATATDCLTGGNPSPIAVNDAVPVPAGKTVSCFPLKASTTVSNSQHDTITGYSGSIISLFQYLLLYKSFSVSLLRSSRQFPIILDSSPVLRSLCFSLL